MKKEVRNSFLLLLAAFIWGTTFVAQSKGGDAFGPYTFNCVRSLIGALVLLPVIKIADQSGISKRRPVSKQERKKLILGGICCGVPMFLAANVQQLGIYLGTPIGKAGFLTATYIILVPILGIFLKKKCSAQVWISVMISLVGLYLLCITGSFSLQLSDALMLLSALLFSVQIQVIDRFSPLCDGIRLSCIQLLTCAVLGLIPMGLTEIGHNAVDFQIWLSPFTSSSAWLSLLYAGVLSSGIAYTLQIIGQDGVDPTIASLLMSLESVFSVLAGAVVLKEYLTKRELWGCLLIFVAIILVQVPVSKIKVTNEMFMKK